jgi:hypothetical protein
MADMISCNQCKQDGHPFVVPYDEIGQALMQQHLDSAHNQNRIPLQGDHKNLGPSDPNE